MLQLSLRRIAKKQLVLYGVVCFCFFKVLDNSRYRNSCATKEEILKSLRELPDPFEVGNPGTVSQPTLSKSEVFVNGVRQKSASFLKPTIPNLAHLSKPVLSRLTPTHKPTSQNSAHIRKTSLSYGKKEVEKGKSKPLIKTISDLLEKKFSLPLVHKVKLPTEPCLRKELVANSCNKTCLRMKLSNNTKERLAQIVYNRKLQLTPKQHEILREMAQKVPGKYDVVITTGASSNHFNESQMLLKNLHQNVFPHLKNFTLIYYNLGLKFYERMRLVKYCRCHVVDFPFEKFPSFFKKLGCFTWKPIIIKAHVKQANILMWLDSSVRFNKLPDKLYLAIKRTRERGMQLPVLPNTPTNVQTMPSMYHFFGDENCAYTGFGEIAAGSGFYANEYLVRRLILEPWVACAFSRQCMCPAPHPPNDKKKSEEMYRAFKAGTGPLKYGLLHRFDQSALNILVSKTYFTRYRDVLFIRPDYLEIRRGDTENYLPYV